MASTNSVCGSLPVSKLKERPISTKRSASWEVTSDTPTPGEDQVSMGSIPSECELTIGLSEPDAIIMDQHLQDRDIADVLDAAHKGSYLGTRSRNKDKLVSMTDSSIG